MSQDFLIFDRNLLLKKKSHAGILKEIRELNSKEYICKADFLIKRSLEDILERLNEITRDFPIILNLGCRNSYGSMELTNRTGAKRLIETDLVLTQSNYSKIVADEELLPFADNQFDLIVSVLNLHLINDLPGCFIQLQKMLKPNGVLIASMFGEENLPELRKTLLKTELECLKGISPRTMPCVELKQLGNLLQRAGFNTAVIDKDHVEVHYSHPLKLIEDLRNMGETNILINRNKNYVGKEFWLKFSENYTKDFNNIASFEILNLIATK